MQNGGQVVIASSKNFFSIFPRSAKGANNINTSDSRQGCIGKKETGLGRGGRGESEKTPALQ